jgi:hypothetical protein
MRRFYVGLFTIMTLAAVAFAGVVIPQLSEQSIARNHKDNNNHNNKVTICHRPPDNPDNYQTIEIKRSALQDHLSHGDLVCACDPDGDGFLCDVDQCDNDPNKTESGVCGCGVADTDSDGDNIADCNDACPNDPDNDIDGDGVCGDVDGCPNDANKTDPGQCGCGNPDTDTDQDTIADCNDSCPNDPDNDIDGDGVCGDVDGCPNDANKTDPGQCGCGNPDTDTDQDTVADCNDGCDNDPNKTAPGVCGCGIADADSDGDGVADCNDQCPGQADDADNDGYLSCVDDCNDNDPGVNPGVLLDNQCDGIDSDCSEGLGGCEPLCEFQQCLGKACREQVSDGCGGTYTCGGNIDNDGDGVNCLNDACDNDPSKTEPGLCGCGVSDEGVVDADGDNCYSCVDCDDNNPNIRPNNCQGDGIIKVDQVCDGIDSDCSEGLGGCEPLTEDPLCCPVQCGPASDGCGGTIDCGSCGGLDQACFQGSCVQCQIPTCNVFDPEDPSLPSGTTPGIECGVKSDGCGGWYVCPNEGQCPEGTKCNEVTNRCEDPCGNKCSDPSLCDHDTGLCEPDPTVCQTDCKNFGTNPDSPNVCGDPDGCGGFCTLCSLPGEQACVVSADLASVFSLFTSGEVAESYCAPLCSNTPSYFECGPCIEPLVTPLGTIYTLGENLCPAGSECQKTIIDGEFISADCVDVGDPTHSCDEICTSYETCNVDMGKCECCGEDLLGNEFCNFCIDGLEVCSNSLLGIVKCCSPGFLNTCEE